MMAAGWFDPNLSRFIRVNSFFGRKLGYSQLNLVAWVSNNRRICEKTLVMFGGSCSGVELMVQVNGTML